MDSLKCQYLCYRNTKAAYNRTQFLHIFAYRKGQTRPSVEKSLKEKYQINIDLHR